MRGVTRNSPTAALVRGRNFAGALRRTGRERWGAMGVSGYTRCVTRTQWPGAWTGVQKSARRGARRGGGSGVQKARPDWWPKHVVVAPSLGCVLPINLL